MASSYCWMGCSECKVKLYCVLGYLFHTLFSYCSNSALAELFYPGSFVILYFMFSLVFYAPLSMLEVNI